MAKISIRYFTTRPRKDGTCRYMWQPNKALKDAGWKLTRLSDDKAEAIEQAELINRQVDEWRAGLIKEPTTELSGTVDAIISAYKNSRFYTDLAPRTQTDYDSYLKLISQWAGDIQATHITSKSVNDLYENLRDDTPTKAAYLIRVIRLLFSFAETQDLMPRGSNPAAKMRLKLNPKKKSIWSAQDVHDFVTAADALGQHGMATAVYINAWMGQRSADIRTAHTHQYKDGVFEIIQRKTGARVNLPVSMITEIDARIKYQVALNKKYTIGCTHLIRDHNGRPFTKDHFTKTFAKIRKSCLRTIPNDRKAHFETLVFQSLRHTAVTRLAESGCTTAEIASISGHSLKSCEKIIDEYLTRTHKMSANAFEKRKKMENR